MFRPCKICWNWLRGAFRDSRLAGLEVGGFNVFPVVELFANRFAFSLTFELIEASKFIPIEVDGEDCALSDGSADPVIEAVAK